MYENRVLPIGEKGWEPVGSFFFAAAGQLSRCSALFGDGNQPSDIRGRE
jgi:hypothetical protein